MANSNNIVSIHLANLSSGTYSLIVRKESSFSWNNVSFRNLEIYIMNAWHGTLTFKVIIALIAFIFFEIILKLWTRYLIQAERKKGLQRYYHINSQIVAAINHDIQTPLHYLGASITHIQEYLSELPIQDAYVSKLGKETVDTINLTRAHANNLLNYIKSQNPGNILRIKSGVVDIYNLVATSCHLLSGVAGYLKVSIVNNVPDEFKTLSDSNLLAVVIQNLLDNAVKFSTAKVVVSAVMVNQRVKIIIDDSGNGLPNEVFEWINKKYRSYEEWIRGYELPDRSGLGLVIVKDLCILLRIDLSVENIPGVGSSFSLVFPLNSNENPTETGGV